MQEELESEKNKTDDGASAWIEKSKQLETEVEWTKELADRLDRLNQSLTRENQRLKTQFTTQENDREFLVKQLVGVKKDNVRLRNEYEALQRDLQQLRDDSQRSQALHSSGGGGSLPVSSMGLSSASTSALPRMGAGGTATSAAAASGMMGRPNTAAALTSAATAPGIADADNRYKEIIKRLKRLLEVERRNLQHVRAAYNAELQGRTELELVVKECMQDVRAEIAHQSQQLLPPVLGTSTTAAAAAAGSVNTLSSDARLGIAERQRLVDKLLAKERLLQLLAAKAFPVRRAPPGGGASGGDPLFTGALSADEMAKIYAAAADTATSMAGADA